MAEIESELAFKVRKALAQMDENMVPTSSSYAEAAVLLASFIVGASEDEIASGLGYDRQFVDIVGNRLRNAKIWMAGEVDPRARARWESEGGAVAFSCDVNVALGQFVVVSYGADGEPAYTMTESGKKRVETMLRGKD